VKNFHFPIVWKKTLGNSQNSQGAGASTRGMWCIFISFHWVHGWQAISVVFFCYRDESELFKMKQPPVRVTFV